LSVILTGGSAKNVCRPHRTEKCHFCPAFRLTPEGFFVLKPQETNQWQSSHLAGFVRFSVRMKKEENYADSIKKQEANPIE
jgi:hypothetical protein